MSYAILRAKKLKTMGAIAGSGKHTYREQETPNADSQRLKLNKHRGPKDTGQLLSAFRNAMPAKVRKNAVLGKSHSVFFISSAKPE